MRTKVKKLTSVILAVVMMLGILTIVPLTVSAATYGDFEYTLEDDYTCTITKYNGSAANVTIPSTIHDYKVCKIGAGAFYDCSSLEKIVIPDSVKEICWSPMYGCFQKCNNLKEIYIGSGFEKSLFDMYTLSGCNSLEKIVFSEDNNYYCSIDGVPFDKSKTSICRYPAGKKDKEYTIPDTVSELSMADYKKSSVHCHSTMCDGKNTLQDMASAACAQGLTTLGFTGHSYTQRDREYCMSPSRTAQYKATIAKLKAEYKGKVDILCGIEWDLLSEDKRTGYDYWIGSAHHLYGKNTGKYYEIDFRPQDLHDCIFDDFDGDPLAAVEAYFAEVEKVAAKGPDILAHIDLIKKLNANGEFFDEESPRYKAAALKALQAAKANDCLLEVNTGGVYRGYRKDFYPGPWLLGEWQKMGGKVIITSDSHDINSLTYGFEEAAAAIKAAGFTSVEVLTGHGFETQEL